MGIKGLSVHVILCNEERKRCLTCAVIGERVNLREDIHDGVSLHTFVCIYAGVVFARIQKWES